MTTTDSSTTATTWDCTNTVREVIKLSPATKDVFASHGIDTCCGSDISVEEACHRDNIDTNALCDKLRAAAGAGTPQ